jgi:hypothetical protein
MRHANSAAAAMNAGTAATTHTFESTMASTSNEANASERTKGFLLKKLGAPTHPNYPSQNPPKPPGIGLGKGSRHPAILRQDASGQLGAGRFAVRSS